MKCTNNYIVRANIRRGLRLDDRGHIILPSGKLFSGQTKSHGYRLIALRTLTGRKATASVARILCWLHHGPPPTNRHEVDHIDRNPGNDSLSNLRWVTHSENSNNVDEKYAGDKHASSKLRERDVRKIRKMCKHREHSHSKIGERFGVSRYTIDHISCGRTWKHIKHED